MFDAMSLLGGFLQGRPTGSLPGRFSAASQQSGLLQQVFSQLGGAAGGSGAGMATGGGLGGLLGSLTGGGGTQGGGMLGEFAAMAQRAVASPRAELASNNPAAVGGLGALAGAVLGGGRGAIGGGLMAVLGSLAYSALQNATATAPASAATSPGTSPGASLDASPGTTPITALAQVPGYSDPAEVQRKATLMFRAMIQACKADGNIDAAEADRLTRHLSQPGQSAEADAFVQQELQRPVDIAGLARDVKSRSEAAEVYAASIMAIDVDTDVERKYLAALAEALTLPPAAVAQIEASLNVRA